jgi:hypothetical protein
VLRAALASPVARHRSPRSAVPGPVAQTDAKVAELGVALYKPLGRIPCHAQTLGLILGKRPLRLTNQEAKIERSAAPYATALRDRCRGRRRAGPGNGRMTSLRRAFTFAGKEPPSGGRCSVTASNTIGRATAVSSAFRVRSERQPYRSAKESMKHAHHRTGIAVIAGAVLAVTLPAGALGAAKPSSGFYLQTKGSPPATFVSFSLKGTKLYDFTHFDKCVADLFQTRLVTNLHGVDFSFHQVVTAEGGVGKYDVKFSGHFISATSAAGTATYKKIKGDALGPAGCHSAIKFTVKRDGPARPPNK